MHILTFNLNDFAFYKTVVRAECSETHRPIVKNSIIISKLSTYLENKRLTLALGILVGDEDV